MIKNLLKTLPVWLLLLYSSNSTAGFHIKDGQLLDSNNEPFIIRGINHPYTWFTDRNQAFADIANTGANAVRVVLSNGKRWDRNSGKEIAEILQLCKKNQLIAILEVHDATGWGEAKEAVSIMTAVEYWTSDDVFPAIRGEEDTVIINIANEPFGNKLEPGIYVEQTINSIKALRKFGLSHTLMIDGNNWGQDWQFTMRDHAEKIAEVDPQKNIIFDVHMYQIFNKPEVVKNYIRSFVDRKLPLVIGEFGADHQGEDVDEDSIFHYAEHYGIGYLGWSWSGNADCCTSLDIVLDFDPKKLSPWGERLIHGKNGIKETSRKASIFTNESNTTIKE